MFSQTCCTAAAPIGNSLMPASSGASTIQWVFDYSFRAINRLIIDNDVVPNDPRRRNNQGMQWSAFIPLFNNMGISASLGLRHQLRQTLSETQGSLGLADPQLAIYGFLPMQQSTIGLSLGVELPVGQTQSMDSRGIVLAPDLQAGSGTWDYSAQLQWILPTNRSTSSNFVFNSLFKWNGENPSFAGSDTDPGRQFSFGNEWQTAIQYYHNGAFISTLLRPDISLKYRWQAANIEQEVVAANSGGHWTFIGIGTSMALSEQWSLRGYAEYPLWQQVDGTQISASFEFGTRIHYSFERRDPSPRKTIRL